MRTKANSGGDESRSIGPTSIDPFFELSLDMLCIAGTDGFFKRINPAFERTLGYALEELMSRPFLDFVHPDDVEWTIREIQSLAAGMPVVLFENRYIDSRGGVHWIQWNASAPNGEGMIYAIARDITAHKLREEELLRYATDLEQSNRQLRVAQEQLIEAEKMESVGRLAAGVAHEVRNPLALLLLGVNYLSDGIDTNDPQIPKLLAEMKTAITRADRIVHGLVSFASEKRLLLGPVDFENLVEDVLLMMHHALTRHTVHVDLDVEKKLPPLLADRGRLEQILVNLITNAIQAMEDTDAPTLLIRARRGVMEKMPRDPGTRTMDHLRDGDEIVIIEVIDNGPGVTPANLAKIFDPFFTTKATGVGTGLGLTVVRSLIDLHRGLIDIRNNVETGGAQVSITLKTAHPIL